MQQSNGTVDQKNIHAILQQRRLRHVSGVCIRNLNLKKYDGVKCKRVYIKILASGTVNNDDGGVIFETEHVDICTNPSWLGFELPKSVETIGNIVHLELWVEDQDISEKALTWTWNLARLHYIAERLYHGEITFSPNALVLQIHGSFYSISECFSTDTPHGNCPNFNLDEEKISCNLFSLQRMVTSLQSIARSQLRSKEHADLCNSFLHEQQLQIEQTKKIENLKSRIKMLRFLLNREESMLKSEREELEKLQHDVKEKEKALSESRNAVVQQRDRSDEVSGQLVVNRKRTGLLNRQLTSRRVEVLSELAYIFPILPYTPPNGSKSQSSKNPKQPKTTPSLMICSIHLPEAESLNAKEDSKNAVAMGYVSQMLYMICYFLLIPLRYPLMLQGSQSSIVDNITDKIQEKERIFPLFIKTNKDRFLFEYGVYLLNKNIGQMRYILGIPTSDLRPTLHNLKALLEHAISAQASGYLMVRPPPSISPSKSPSQKTSPKPERKTEQQNTMLVQGNSEVNGLCTASLKLEEKAHDKSMELSTLRGELFGSRKPSKPITMSPRRMTSSPSTAQKISPAASPSKISSGATKSPNHDINVAADLNASFLSGLEDLENSSKDKADAKKPLDNTAARHELFKTKSGRSVVPKKIISIVRTGNTDNYTAAKENLFNKIQKDTSSPLKSTGVSQKSTAENGISPSENGESENEENLSNTTSYSMAPMHAPEEIDLC